MCWWRCRYSPAVRTRCGSFCCGWTRPGPRASICWSCASPYNNAPEFARRGLQLRWPPYQTLYNFWYAGGLPVAGSELECLRLLEFAAQQDLRLGVHYCSLENKNTGQVWQQNHGSPAQTPP